MDSSSLVFRVFREGDDSAVVQFLNKQAGVECSLKEWAWLYPPERDGRAIFIGERNGDVAAVCAGTPLRVTINGREWAAVKLQKVVSSKIDDAGRILEHVIDALRSNGRFAVAIAALESGARILSGFYSTPHPRLSVLVRKQPTAGHNNRFLYRAEAAPDWEPRLDELWRHARKSYPVAVVRDADYALRRFSAHPTIQHHRFMVFPRLSNRAVAFAAFSIDGDRFRWLDLVWDHDHPGALELLAHISGRLVKQLGRVGEEMWLAGDDETRSVLMSRGFFADETSPAPVVAARSLSPELDPTTFVEDTYMTLVDVESVVS